MRSEWFADILLILLISSIIMVILCWVNRGKRKTKPPTNAVQPENNNQE
jgi:hypothetical protein